MLAERGRQVLRRAAPDSRVGGDQAGDGQERGDVDQHIAEIQVARPDPRSAIGYLRRPELWIMTQTAGTGELLKCVIAVVVVSNGSA